MITDTIPIPNSAEDWIEADHYEHRFFLELAAAEGRKILSPLTGLESYTQFRSPR